MAGPTGEQDWYLSGVFAMSFINLNDTFGDFVDRAGKVPKINSEEDALEPSDIYIDNHSGRHEDGGGDALDMANLVHAGLHKDGGADELDVSELAAAIGDAGDIVESDGAAASWVNPSGRYKPPTHDKTYHDATVLDEDNLAAEGGSVPEVDRENAFTVLQVVKDLQVTGIDRPTSGVGFEMEYDVELGEGCIRAYDRGTANYKGIVYSAVFHKFNQGGIFSDNAIDGNKGEDTTNFKEYYRDGDLVFQEATVSLGGDFGAGQNVKCSKAGNQVTIHSLGTLSHASGYNPGSAAGAIPSAYRPSYSANNTYWFTGSRVCRVYVNPSGDLTLWYNGWGGTTASDITSGEAFSISYCL